MRDSKAMQSITTTAIVCTLATILLCLCGCDVPDQDGMTERSKEVSMGDVTAQRRSALLDQIDRATELLEEQWAAQLSDDLLPPEKGFFRAYHLRRELFVSVLHDGLAHFVTSEYTGPYLDETILACEQVNALGWAHMLRETRDVVFPEGAPTGEAYDRWQSDHYVLSDEIQARLREIESEVLYAEPSRTAEFPMLEIDAAIEADIPGISGLISDKQLFQAWVQEEKNRFSRPE